MENSTIYINFNDTIQKAESLIELANQLRTLSNGSLKETGSNLNGVWSGDAAEMYKNSLYDLAERIDKHANAVELAANGLKGSAERLLNLEKIAIDIFSKQHNG